VRAAPLTTRIPPVPRIRHTNARAMPILHPIRCQAFNGGISGAAGAGAVELDAIEELQALSGVGIEAMDTGHEDPRKRLRMLSICCVLR
jgi:hypothetical protein